MAAKVGLDCKLYRNTATYGSPTWNEVTCARDVSLNISVGAADVSSRASVIKKELPTLVEIGFDVELLSDAAIDDYDVMRDAALARTVVGFAIADGAIATTGTKYFRCECFITGFNPAQPLEGGNVTPCTLKLAHTANADPAWTTV